MIRLIFFPNAFHDKKKRATLNWQFVVLIVFMLFHKYVSQKVVLGFLTIKEEKKKSEMQHTAPQSRTDCSSVRISPCTSYVFGQVALPL